jgi:phospholipid/cholesterol/gamma-HCH transport system ATP-binding protein
MANRALVGGSGPACALPATLQETMAIERTQARSAIELDGVCKDLGGARVLDGVDLEVPAGAITVLLGPSGAGKTVTIKHVLGLFEPTRGSVRVEGKDLSTLKEEELYALRQAMGVVLQGTLPFTCGLFYSLTVFENVAFVLRRRTRMSEEEIRESVLQHLGMVGLRDRANAMPDQLSAGMTKRVALARALIADSRIVIVDDFDSGIDRVRLALLCDLLRDAQRDTGATYLLATHDMTAARRLADHVAVIGDGRIVASGPAEEVLGSSDPFVRQLITGATSGPVKLHS